MSTELEKLRFAEQRAGVRARLADDAGLSTEKLDAAHRRARARVDGYGKLKQKSAAQLEIEIAHSLAKAWSEKHRGELKIQKEGAKFYVVRWIGGEAPELVGPFRTEAAACKRLAELAR